MARGRFVSRSISGSEQLASVSLAADFFFSRVIPHLDVEGRINGNPAILKGVVFPLRNEITTETIPGLIGELASAVDANGLSLVVWYEVGQHKVLEFPRFAEHQTGLRKDKEAPSRLPPVSSATRILSGPTSIEVRTNSGATPDLSRTNDAPREVEVEGEVQEKGEAVDLEHPTADGSADEPAVGQSPETATASPPALQENRKAQPHSRPLPPAALRVLAECYGSDLGGTGWTSRQNQVHDDLVATLYEGAVLERGVRVRAADAAHLGECCSRVLANGLRKPDAALRLVLLELRKTYQETIAAREKEAFGEEPPRETGKTPAASSIRSLIFSPDPDGSRAASDWFDGLSPPEHETIAAEIERTVSISCPPNRAPSYRAHLRAETLVDIWKRETSAAEPTDA